MQLLNRRIAFVPAAICLTVDEHLADVAENLIESSPRPAGHRFVGGVNQVDEEQLTDAGAAGQTERGVEHRLREPGDDHEKGRHLMELGKHSRRFGLGAKSRLRTAIRRGSTIEHVGTDLSCRPGPGQLALRRGHFRLRPGHYRLSVLIFN